MYSHPSVPLFFFLPSSDQRLTPTPTVDHGHGNERRNCARRRRRLSLRRKRRRLHDRPMKNAASASRARIFACTHARTCVLAHTRPPGPLLGCPPDRLRPPRIAWPVPQATNITANRIPRQPPDLVLRACEHFTWYCTRMAYPRSPPMAVAHHACCACVLYACDKTKCYALLASPAFLSSRTRHPVASEPIESLVLPADLISYILPQLLGCRSKLDLDLRFQQEI